MSHITDGFNYEEQGGQFKDSQAGVWLILATSGKFFYEFACNWRP